MPTAAQKKQLLTYAKRLIRLERIGVRVGTRLGNEMHAAVIRAMRSGKNPTKVLKKYFEEIRKAIHAAMVTAHLAGMDHAWSRAPKSALKLSVSPWYENMQRWFEKKTRLQQADVARIEDMYAKEAISLSGSLGAKVERDLTKSIQESVAEARTVAESAQELRQVFEANGMVPGKQHALETLFRTQVQIAGSAGQYYADQDPILQAAIWGYEYITFADDRVRPSHAELEGIILPKDDAWWNINYPPNGWNCRCTVVPVFEPPDGYSKPTIPKTVKDVDGKEWHVGADKGFRFHPGKVFSPEGDPPLPPWKKPAPRPRPKRPAPKPKPPVPIPRTGPVPKSDVLEAPTVKRSIQKARIEESVESLEKKLGLGGVEGREKVQLHGWRKVKDAGKLEKTLSAVHESIDEMQNAFPQMMQRIHQAHFNQVHLYNNYRIPRYRGRYVGGCWTEDIGRMELTTQRVATQQWNALGEGFHNVDYSTTGIFRHELGHTYHRRMVNYDEWKDIWRKTSAAEIRAGISEYASTSMYEMWAESFCAYTNPHYGKNAVIGAPKRLPRHVEEFMVKEVGVHPNLVAEYGKTAA